MTEPTIVSTKRPINPILLIAVFFEIIYPLFETMRLPHSLVVYTRFALTSLAIFLVVTYDKKIFSYKAVRLYIIWTLYILFRNVLMGYGVWTSHIQMFLAIVPSFTTFLICVHGYKRDENLLIKVIIVALYFFVLYGMIRGGSTSLTGGIADDERLGGELINANAIGIRASLIFFFTTLLFIRQQLKFGGYVALSVIPALAVLMSGSRTGFVISVLVASVFIFSNSKRSNTWIWKLAFLIVASYGMYYILYSTSMGERLLSITTQAEDYHLDTGTAWDTFGDRGYQYYTSIPYIADNLWFGIGMGNYINKVSGAVTVLHSEYLIQLLECGLIAFILYFWMYLATSRALFKGLKVENDAVAKNVKILCLLFMIAMFFVCFVTRVCYYGMYSCCLAYLVYQGYSQKIVKK